MSPWDVLGWLLCGIAFCFLIICLTIAVAGVRAALSRQVGEPGTPRRKRIDLG